MPVETFQPWSNSPSTPRQSDWPDRFCRTCVLSKPGAGAVRRSARNVCIPAIADWLLSQRPCCLSSYSSTGFYGLRVETWWLESPAVPSQGSRKGFFKIFLRPRLRESSGFIETALFRNRTRKKQTRLHEAVFKRKYVNTNPLDPLKTM